METKNITEIIPEYIEEIKEISENITDLSLFYEQSREDMSWFNRLFSPKTMEDMKSEKDIERFSKYFDKYINDKLQQIKTEYITPIEQELSASEKDLAQLKKPQIENLHNLYNCLHILDSKKYRTSYLSKKDSLQVFHTPINIKGEITLSELIIQLENNPEIQKLMIGHQDLFTDIYELIKKIEDIKNLKTGELWKYFCIKKRLIFQPYKEFQFMVKSFNASYSNENYFIECYNEFQLLLDEIQFDNELRNEEDVKTLLENKNEELKIKTEIAIQTVLQQIKDIENKSELYQMYIKTKNNYETAINNYKEYLKVLNNNYDIMNTISEKTKQVIDYTWQYRKSIKHLEQSSDLSIILKDIADNQFGVQAIIDKMINCSEKLLTITQTSEEILKLS